MVSLGQVRIALLLAVGATSVTIAGDEPWWSDEAASAQTAAVNEGDLVFLSAPPEGRAHHHENTIVIESTSLADGWVRLHQCHRDLDPVPRAEVVFRSERTQELKVTAYTNIDRAWVEGSSVQLAGVGTGARLCLDARSRALRPDGQHAYRLRNGPFMRRFLDGYYPMHVRLQARYPCTALAYTGVSPAPQPGFHVELAECTDLPGCCQVAVDALFNGRLNTEIRFRTLSSEADTTGE